METPTKYKTSHTLYQRACKSIPGGVNSPVRAFNGVGGTPIFFQSGKGPYVTDVDGNTYIDYVCSWGPLILGHAHPKILEALGETAAHGTSFGAPTYLEIEMAEQICAMIPSIEKVRMVNSGTEATMTAIRLARGITHRDTLVKFEGCYHGHEDALLVKAGSGALTLGQPSSPGIPNAVTQNTLTLPYNDTEALEDCFKTHGEKIAGVIIEPIAGNMNFVPPNPDYLTRLRELTHTHKSILIFDEVMTGFRVHPQGAQGLFNIQPDLTTFGKVIGGGLPVGAIGGKAEYMDYLAPVGPVYQAGTLSGNPLAMSVGLTTLKLISQPDFYPPIFEYTDTLCTEMKTLANEIGIPFTAQHRGCMFGFFFNDQEEVTCFEDVMQGDQNRFKYFFHSMLDSGVYLAPSAFEAGFVSAAHNPNTLEKTLEAAKQSFKHCRTG